MSKKISSSNSIELTFAILSGVAWLVGISFYLFYDGYRSVSQVCYGCGILFGGFFTVVEAGKSMMKGQFKIDFLMIVAALGSMALGRWSDAGLLLFLFSLGHALEHYAMKRARKSISALVDLASHIALVRRSSQLVEVDIQDLIIGDRVVIKPHSKIAADGIVIKGSSSVDQSPITGESVPVGKSMIESPDNWSDFGHIPIENKVFAGTINGSGLLEVEVRKLANDSTLARLISLVKEAETQKSPTQHLADNFEKYYIPIVLISVTALLFAFLIIDETFQQSFYRAMSVLIAASPCALAISTPSAVLAAIARAAKQGVLIKGGKPLEELSLVDAIAFDKTGTLTVGQPKLTHVVPTNEELRELLLKVAIAVESLSDHPLARAIVEGAKNQLRSVDNPQANDLVALMARGVRANYEGKQVHIGNRRLIEEVTSCAVPNHIDSIMSDIESKGSTAMVLHIQDRFLGVIGVMDVAREEAKHTVDALKQIGIKKLIMLTGDHQRVADAIAKEIGIQNPMGSLLPEDKVRAIEALTTINYKVAMVGDGVNDAPAMARSAVGIAMGAAGSDVALETSDIALMADKLDNLPFAIKLSRKATSIIKQNLIISLGMVIFLVPLTLFGYAEIGLAVIGHEGSTLVVVLNALRLLKFQPN